MPRQIQLKKMQRMAELFKTVFTIDNPAESAFISTARFKGYDDDLIYQVACSYWPDGFAARHCQEDLPDPSQMASPAAREY